MDSFQAAVLLMHAGSTLFMVGLIWFVQIVHYPLFARVGREEFVAYEQIHQRLTTWVVAPTMLTELSTAILLVSLEFTAVSIVSRCIGLALVALIWLTTIFVQMPQHAALAKSYDESLIRKLVVGNWPRTIAWSLRGMLVLWMMGGLRITA